MKQITKIVLGVLLLLLVGTDGAQAQRQYFGFKGGWGEGDIRLYPHWTSPPVWGKLNGGFYWVYYGGGKNSAYLADDYTGGICVEVELLQRGFQYAALDRSTKRYTYGREINSIMVPIMWQPHALLLDERLRIFLNAGTTLSYNLNWGSREFYIENETGEIVDEYDYEWITVRDNRWAYGLVVGLGAGWRSGNIEVMFEGRYYFGYSDIVKRKTIYLGTQFLRSPLDNINFSLGVAYCWEHSGSWSFSPAKRKAVRSAQQEILPSGVVTTEGGSTLLINQ
ncbi:MAG: PorT family protein [Tidjanibacter sp.]|nr:PorT family protein [Tidjanibacter sp.]